MLRADRRERRLARAGRPPEDHRRQLSCVDRLPQDAALADDVLLPDELVEVARSHAGRKRGRVGPLASHSSTRIDMIPGRPLGRTEGEPCSTRLAYASSRRSIARWGT